MKSEDLVYSITIVGLVFGGFMLGYYFNEEMADMVFSKDAEAYRLEAKQDAERLFKELNSLCQVYGDDHAAGFITGELDPDKMPKVICYNLTEQKFHYVKFEG